MVSISIIIPAYNQANYLGEAIQSVLDQTCGDFDLVIVDDGSTDDTEKVVSKFRDLRIRCIRQDNRGLSAARNRGLQNSFGKYVTFLDADDLFVPDKLEVLSEALDRDPELGLVAGQAVLIDENRNPLGKIYDTPLPEDPLNFLLWNPLHVGSVMLRRSWQQKVGLFDESLHAYEDWDMWLRLIRAGCRLGSIGRPVSLYRFHGDQMTRDKDRMTAACFAVLDKTYGDPQLPEKWRALKSLAYSGAYLRAAAQAFSFGDFCEGGIALKEAASLDPGLIEGDGSRLMQRLCAIADSPKVAEKLLFIERILSSLPPDFANIERHRKAHLSRIAVEAGFLSFQAGNFNQARSYMWRAARYRPLWLANPGVVSVLVKSSLKH